MQYKWINYLGYLIILITFGLLLLFGFWLFYPYKPLVFLNQPFEVLTPEVRQGDLLKYHVDYCKNTTLPATVTRSFVNDIKYTTPQVIATNDVGCRELFPSILVPEIPPGTYHLHNSYLYKVNPIRNIVVIASTSAFTVIK